MKEVMLTMLLQDIGQRLSHKPFKWMSWWWGLRWGAFIEIHPPLTQETPLWNRDDTSLKSIRLFGLTPNQLQSEITYYWKKPFWHKWLSRLFTSIGSKMTIWAYYQRCLSLRAIQKQNPIVDQPLLSYKPEQKIITVLVTALSRDSLALEQRLEKYSGNLEWMQKNFSSVLTNHEKKKRRSFLSLMEKHLKKLPTEYDLYLIRRKLKKEYQEIEKMLRAYLKDGQSTFSEQHTSTQSEAGDNALVYVGPTIRTERAINLSSESDLSCSMKSINLWVNRRRQVIDALLQEELSEEEQTNKIKIVLEESLNSLSSHIDPQVEGYQRIVKEAIQGKVNYREVIEWSKSLQSSLLKLYRNGVRLFHPDKINGSVGLQMLLTDLFQQFKRSSESAMEKIQRGQESLKEWFGYSPELELRIGQLLQEMTEERIRHSEFMKQKLNELGELQKSNIEQFNVLKQQVKDNKEIVDANGEEIKKLTKLVKQFLPISENQAQEQEENEKATTSFSPRP